jgi:hypothetical protein
MLQGHREQQVVRHGRVVDTTTHPDMPAKGNTGATAMSMTLATVAIFHSRLLM